MGGKVLADGVVLVADIEYQIIGGTRRRVNADNLDDGRASIPGLAQPPSVQLSGLDQLTLIRMSQADDLVFLSEDGSRLRCVLRPGGVLRGLGGFQASGK